MKNFILIVIAVALSSFAYSQNDSTLYINGLPVTEDDTVQQFPEGDLGPRNKLTPLSPASLPGKVVRALEKGDQYEGWSDTVVYYDANNRLFLIPVKSDRGVRIFGLNEDGHPVTYDEVNDPEPR